MRGKSITVPATRLMAFVDETGEESLRDPEYPVFGLAGCAMRADSYFGLVAPAWRRLKLEQLGDENAPLHAAEIDLNNAPLVEALGQFFRREHFSRFGATLTHLTELAGLEPYELAAHALLNRLSSVVRYWSGNDGITFICEQSSRGDELAQKHLSQWNYWGEIDGTKVDFPVDRHFMPKSANEPGLEIADFIAHTLGTTSRAFMRGQKTPRADFRAMIIEVEQRLVSVMDVKAARVGKGEHSEEATVV